jgi:hypothetical protein
MTNLASVATLDKIVARFNIEHYRQKRPTSATGQNDKLCLI